MADKGMHLGFATQAPPVASSRPFLVAAFRASLAGRVSPLETVDPAQLAQARDQFRAIAEVAGEPFAVPAAE